MRSGRFLRFEQLCLLKKKKKNPLAPGIILTGMWFPLVVVERVANFLYCYFFFSCHLLSQQILKEDLLYIRFCVRDEQIKDSFISKNLTRVEDRKPKY